MARALGHRIVAGDHLVDLHLDVRDAGVKATQARPEVLVAGVLSEPGLVVEDGAGTSSG